MTISNADFTPYIFEIEFEGVEGTFSGKFLQSTNLPSATGLGVDYWEAKAFRNVPHTTDDATAESIGFINNVLNPALKRIRAAHGEAPIRLIATRVYVTPATYSTSP